MLEAMHPIDEYLHFLKRIIGEIRKNGAEIIFATSVPFLNKEDNDRIVAYNDAAKKLMADENIAVNDLYSLMLQGKNLYKCEDMVHLTQEGYKVCANQAARIIREKLHHSDG
jgi:lysophospholipase L1-like esterase